MAEGFLGRWSQRKQAAREGKALAEPPEPSPQPSPAASGRQEPDASALAALVPPPHPAPPPLVGEGRAEGASEAPALTMDDVTRLTAQSDFAPFVARDVAPELRNAAMKKLFADPHYKLMDRLDTYIDDYSQPDPLPQSMLRQMASAQFLKLFEHEQDSARQDPLGAGAREDANTAELNSMPQSAQLPPADAHPLTDSLPQALGTANDHTDLQLQPHHAAGRRESGRGTE